MAHHSAYEVAKSSGLATRTPSDGAAFQMSIMVSLEREVERAEVNGG